MKILIPFVVLLFLLLLVLANGPFKTGLHDFQAQSQTDNFSVLTGVGSDNATVQLRLLPWNSDTSTIAITSNDTTDTPFPYSLNITNRALIISGLVASAAHYLTITYDTDSLGSAPAVSGFISTGIPWYLFLIPIIIIPIAVLIILWRHR